MKAPLGERGRRLGAAKEALSFGAAISDGRKEGAGFPVSDRSHPGSLGRTVFKVHSGKLTRKIYTQGERVLRIEVIVHHTQELGCGRSMPNFGKIVQLLRGMLVRFLNVLHFIDVCFIADDMLEKLPTALRVGQTKAGGVDFNRPRMRAVAHAVIALATSPERFTASQLAHKVP